MKVSYKLKIIIQDLIEIPVFLTGSRKDHWKVERYNSYIESSDKNRCIILIRRLSSALFVPW